MRPLIVGAWMGVLGLSAASAQARTFRVEQVPHGGTFSCEVCHLPAGGLNDFGYDAFLHLDNPQDALEWGELYLLDSDGDGYSNGEELGDPEGAWEPGDSDPPGEFSNPGLFEDGLCGNGVLDGAEDCEGDVEGVDCQALGLGPGPVTCGSDCRFDTAACDSCGDGVKLPGEECDGADFGGATCSYLQLGSGSLACNGCRIDTSGCSGPTTNAGMFCGDTIQSGNELCDGDELGGASCESLGYGAGRLACRDYCTFDTTGCDGDVPDTAVTEFDRAGVDAPEVIDEETQLPDGGCNVGGRSRFDFPGVLLMVAGLLLARRRRRTATR